MKTASARLGVWIVICTGVLSVVGCPLLAPCQTLERQRPPAVPLVAHDPYFSIWSMADKLTDEDTRHWTGSTQPLCGLARIDGTVYRFMGSSPQQVPAMDQVSLQVTATHSAYLFEAGGVRVAVSFYTPALPHDLEALSRPVTYLSWQLTAADGKPHSVSLYLDVDPRVAVNSDDEEVTLFRSKTHGLDVLSVGSRDQRVLNRAGDNLRIDWGYFHLAVPESERASLATSSSSRASFVQTGALPASDDLDMPLQPRDGAAHLAVVLPADVPASQPVQLHVLLGFTESYSIEYLQRKLRPYWQRNGKTSGDMLAEAEAQYADLEKRGQQFDGDLARDLDRVGGKAYTQMAVLAYRQTLAAHGLAADLDGAPMLFPKENFSNGCISTVDVLYPSAPFFLFFNPALLEAQLKPVLEYSALPRWKWPFAPHDLGTYPLANGQVYGGGERTEEDQMPVEESGNMLIMLDALGQEEGNWRLSERYWPQLSKWADYLRDKGLDPENQLSTDDFAGHLAHNANLSIKAIEALAAYAQIAKGLGKNDTAKEYAATAKQMAEKWQTLARSGDHYVLAFDKPDTWSQKYNLVWDRQLGLDLFPDEVRRMELAFYLKHLNRYGLPLDNRVDYTKLDWQVWTATLAEQPSQFDTLLAPVGTWLNEGPTRVPLTDWYDTKTGKMVGFQARSVVGGVYMKALSDKQLLAKWSRGAY